MKQQPQTFKMVWPSSTIKLTEDQAKEIGIDISQEEQRGETKTSGPWNLPISYKAICVSAVYGVPEGCFTPTCLEKTIYGIRTMTNVRESGYCLDGYVSIKGKKYSCFTSSELFEVNGKLIDVAVIHARVK